MDVFSLLKFWRTTSRTGEVTPVAAADFNSSIDEEDSFFDFVFTNKADDNDYSYVDSPNNNGFCADEVYLPESQSQFPLRVVIEEVKIGALLKRDNSLRCKLLTEKIMETESTPSKRFSKDVVNKYLNKVKAKASKRNSQKSRLSEKDNTPSSSPASSSSVFSPRKEEKRNGGGGGGNAVFREVRKRLGKSRSASAIMQTPKSDDSAIEQQDGIQGAILHCKRSYNLPAASGCVLSRSGSAPSNNQQRISVEEDDTSTI